MRSPQFFQVDHPGISFGKYRKQGQACLAADDYYYGEHNKYTPHQVTIRHGHTDHQALAVKTVTEAEPPHQSV